MTMQQDDIIDSVIQAVHDVEHGYVEALGVYIALKNLGEHIDQAINQIKPQALNEARQYHNQEYHGYQIEVREAGGRYSYDHIPEYAQLKERLKVIEKQAQVAYKLSATNLGSMVVTGDGEEMLPAHYKTGSTAIVLKKGA